MIETEAVRTADYSRSVYYGWWVLAATALTGLATWQVAPAFGQGQPAPRSAPIAAGKP
jgi:hypothetical protein